jgi:spore germination cell wall hydrolase CwlJ-like protein
MQKSIETIIAVIIAIVAALFAVALVISSADDPPMAVVDAAGRPIAPLPEIPPLELKPVTLDDARSINAAVAFSTKPNPAARPFIFAGDASARARAISCLAAAVLYEAGDDVIGQKAVAQVVLNRARHPAYPKSVCGVVFQGSERRTGCQFTFTCDGALRRIWSASAWATAQGSAIAALTGEVYAPVGLATHYHTDWVVPYWSDDLEKITAVGTHLFFRWPGGWGQPAAYRGALSGAEPAIAKLAALSPAHAGAVDPLSGEGLAAIGADATAGTENAAYVPDGILRPTPEGRVQGSFRAAKSVQTSGDTLYIALDTASNPGEFVALAQSTCGARPYCKVMGWADASAVPAAGQMTDAARAGMSFSYLKNTTEGFEKALWNCSKFPRTDKKQCMKR